MNIDYAKQILIDAVNNDVVPGGTIGFVDLNNEYFTNYGYAQVEPEKQLNNIDTLYDMASCTKVVATTTMILKLYEDKVIDLNDLVTKHLNDFPFDNITITHLLTHTSGLPADDKRYKLCKDKDELIKFIYSLSLNNKPGEVVEYSDFGFIVLGLIIEKYKGNIEEYANELIFKPLGMKNTVYNPYLKNRKQDCACAEITSERGLIRGVVHDGKANILNGISGNAGLFSNVKDISKFIRMLLLDGENILNKETVELLKKPYTDKLNITRTLGWIFGSDENRPYASKCSLYHTGFSGTSIYIDFEKKCGIVLLTNRVHPIRRDVNKVIELRNNVSTCLLKEYE